MSEVKVTERWYALQYIPTQIALLKTRGLVFECSPRDGKVEVRNQGDSWLYDTYQEVYTFLAGVVVGSDEETVMRHPECTEDSSGKCTNPLHNHKGNKS